MTGTSVLPTHLPMGTRISLITVAQFRYEGVVAAINAIDGTLTLQEVCCCGTENRIPPNNVAQTTDHNAQPVGCVYDEITFWISSITKSWIINSSKVDRNEFGDQGIAKAGVAVDGTRQRRQRSWWLNSSDTSRFINTQPRMSVSYPRRGRMMDGVPRQGSYVPVVPVLPSISNTRKNSYISSSRGISTRMANNQVFGSNTGPTIRGNGRRSNQTARRMNGVGDSRRYNQGNINPNTGVFVYLPPDMAAAYQSSGINLVPNRQNPPKRRMNERRTPSRRPGSKEPEEITCKLPYDFETANAELEAELAKISLNIDGTVTNATEGIDNAQVSTNSAASTGDGLDANVHTAVMAVHELVAIPDASANGASGDSSSGAVTSTVNITANDNANSEGRPSNETTGPLAKGEYYVREKCFFDQISRSEGGPRGPFQNGRGMQSTNYSQSVIGSNAGMNFIAAARRERQLNMETFGSMAARSTFSSRRRSTRSVHRDMLVSASA